LFVAVALDAAAAHARLGLALGVRDALAEAVLGDLAGLADQLVGAAQVATVLAAVEQAEERPVGDV
jgi:hypothetical protein